MSGSASPLVAALDRRVPRYTSYPTAPHFHAGITADIYAGWLGALDPASALSLYLHVPFCTRLCWYCGCNTGVAPSYKPIAEYAVLLAQEIGLVADRIARRQAVSHVHWGGGTPTMLAPADLHRLFDVLRARFAISADAEIGFEIDPRTLTPEAVAALAAFGTNRASLGVQDFNPEVQQAVNRVQPYAMTAEAVERLRAAGIEAINIDLMYGLPCQTTARVVETVAQALTLAPNRVALFGYAHVPWMKPHQRLLPEAALPGPAERFEQQQAAGDALQAAGYVRVGLDHFARPDDPLARALQSGRLHRNFQGYTTDTAPVLIGLGASAIGSMPGGYVQNAAGIPAYRKAIREGRLATARGVALQPVDRLIRAIIERLMCELTVDLDAVCRQHAADPAALAGELAGVDALARHGIVHRDGHRITVTEAGRPFVRVVCAVFDRYLQSGPARHAAAV